MSITNKRAGKRREPWNERAVRCVVNHLIPDMKSYSGHATDKLILVNMARHAHPAGCGITVGKYAQADHLGCSDRRVWDAVKRLRRDGRIERTAQRTAERGSDTYRIVLCQRCRVNTAAVACQRCPPPPAAAPPSRLPAVSSGHLNREVQGEPAATAVIPGSWQAGRSPNGDGSRGPARGPRTPGPRRQAAEAAPEHPEDRLERSTAGTVLPFPARSSDAGTQGGAARTGSRLAPGAATGGPFSNPTAGRL
jgi:hypothetical protein